jgi:hypothetical protein
MQRSVHQISHYLFMLVRLFSISGASEAAPQPGFSGRSLSTLAIVRRL